MTDEQELAFWGIWAFAGLAWVHLFNQPHAYILFGWACARAFTVLKRSGGAQA